MWELFMKGGPLMYPLLLCSVLTVAYGIERGWHYSRAGRLRQNPERIHGLLEQGRTAEALALAQETTGPVAAVLAEGLRHAGSSKEMIEEAISLKGAAELERLNQRLHIIELIGRLSPLMGLLGTVLGMVEAFRQVAASRGVVDPGMLAGGIWEALITTVAGLCVAIPAMVLHHFFEDRVRSFAYLMKHYGTEAVKHLGVRA
ncbi:MAG: MotA/TolQ/ExbB proton channel family protein [Thermodesulfobacteriota bacterium]